MKIWISYLLYLFDLIKPRYDSFTYGIENANVSDGDDGTCVYSSREHITSTNDTCLFMISSLIDQPSMLSSTAISNSNAGQWIVPKSDIAGWLSRVLGTTWIFIIRVSFVRYSSITRTVLQTKQHKWSRQKLAGGKKCLGPYLLAYVSRTIRMCNNSH